MIRYIASFVVIAVFSLAGSAKADIASLEEIQSEKSIGSLDAPVTIIEYSSLGCSHCATFHRETFPKVKKNYIDTGKVRLIFRDFPLGAAAMAASKIARCGGNKRFFGYIDAFFRSQKQWLYSGNPLEGLERIARLGGMAPKDVSACLDSQQVQDVLIEGTRQGSLEHQISVTPTFIINGAKVQGALGYEDFKNILDKALAEAAAK